MNKIGILTYHSVCNFGANLQALSTVDYFRNKGYDPIVINWMTDELEAYYKTHTPVEQYNIHEMFVQENLPISCRCRTDEDIMNVIINNNIDTVVIGSDAVLQHHPFLSRIVFPSRKIISLMKIGKDRLFPNPFWGSFLSLADRTIKTVMMSASSQNSPFKLTSQFVKKQQAEYLDRFLYISTRDQWTSDMVSYITGGKIRPIVTPDPVFAFNYNVISEQFSEADIRKKFNLQKKYILFSFHNSKIVSIDWLKEFKEIAVSHDIECIAFPFPQGNKFQHPFDKEVKLPLSPLEWYALIKYSSGYIGNNMHPIVVSLHNAVPCFSFDNYGVVKCRFFLNKDSSKIYAILKEFDLLTNWQSCLIPQKNVSPTFVYEALLNYDKKSVRIKSSEYLSKYLDMMREIEQIINH